MLADFVQRLADAGSLVGQDVPYDDCCRSWHSSIAVDQNATALTPGLIDELKGILEKPDGSGSTKGKYTYHKQIKGEASTSIY